MAFDLRKTTCDDMLIHVAHAFRADFDSGTEVRERRSIGLRTNRNTWVRIEVKDLARFDG